MQAVLADLVADADALFGKVRNAIADELKHNREMIEGGRPFLEAAANSVFAVLVSAKVKNVASHKLDAHIAENFPIILTGNELGALAGVIARHYNKHLDDFHGKLISQSVGNSAILAQNVRKLQSDPHGYLDVHCQTWAATQPFRVVVTKPAFDALIGGMNFIERIVRKAEEDNQGGRRW